MLDKMPSIFVSVFTVSVVFAHLCAGHDYPVCEVNSEMRLCGSHCEPTCENPKQRFCPPADKESCEDECRCLDGFVRNKETGQCCSIEHCPRRKRPKGCSAHEHLALCGRNCEPTCSNPNPDTTSCSRMKCSRHTLACRCVDDHVRNPLTGECCRLEDCPVIKPQPQCSANEHFALCGRNCEPTCKNPNLDSESCPSMECTDQTQACRCKDGHVRNTLTGECCRIEDCPVIKPQPQCSANEHFALCGRNCEPTCKNPNLDSESCPSMECTDRTQACRCKDGHVRNTLTGECCRLEDCPVIKPQPQCSANEHFALCGRNCEPTCKNPNLDSESCPNMECTDQTQACRCKDGHVRNTLTGECCRIEDCPVIKPQPQCSANEHFALCGRNCEPTCKNPNLDSESCPSMECTDQTQACRCKDGHVRNTLTGECCRIEDCPVIKPQPQCSANEHFALCGRNCEPTCKNPNLDSESCPNMECTDETQACRCKDGHVRNTLTGECCRLEDCPVIKPQPQCSANEHFALCGRNCEPTCKNPNLDSESCPNMECTDHTQGCRCKDGHVRNTLTGECCRIEDCPVIKPQPQCSANEHFALCGRNCEPTCKNPNVDSASCPNMECTDHTQGCRCKDGHVRNTLTGECCRIEDCPVVKPQPQCSANEHFALCGCNCEPTCNNPNTNSTSCPKEECTEHTRACRCKDDHVRNTLTGECCRVEDCPVVKPQPQCSANEHFALCGRNCEPTCNNPHPNPMSCPKENCTNHTEACRCIDGHVRNTETGQCVKVDECPKPPPKCSPNEKLALCGRNCEPTCNNPNPNPMSCPKENCTNHTEACRCMDGHVRNTETGQCVKVDECPKPPPKCSPNEKLALCGRICEPTCKNPDLDSICFREEECSKNTEACRCVHGHVRNTETGQCVKVDECPKPPPKCSPNEQLALCGRNCEPTCKNPNPHSMSCPKEKCTKNTEGCRCMQDHVRNTETGQCVKINECPKPPPKCSSNEHFTLCGRNCEPTCKNPKPDSISCPSKECTNHTGACRCMDGYVRNTQSGECCRVEHCPAVKPLPQCSVNEHFARCGRKCEPTCNDLTIDSKSCPITDCSEHTQACRCTQGHVRNTLTGECCKVEDCPKVKPPPKCSANEHLDLCGRNCEPTCKNPSPNPISCPKEKCTKNTEGCRCMQDHVRNTETGQCVKINECPKPPPKCSSNEHFTLCGRNCEPTCKNPKPDSISCPSKECTNHTGACRCMDGYVRNTQSGECCRVEHCPAVKPLPQCSVNEHFARCGRKCEPTCSDLTIDSKSCPITDCSERTQACRCTQGHVRNTLTGECCKVEDCPKVKPPPKCSANEHLDLCGRNCEPTCKNPSPNPISCPKEKCTNHTEACRCMHDHVRNTETGQCVKVDECPKPIPKCLQHEHFALCGRNCEPTCKNPKPDSVSCPSEECTKHSEGCRCTHGYVRNIETGQCVTVDDCPKPPPKCAVNEHFALCGRNCEPTCEHRNPDLMSCSSKECNNHTEACRCMDGHVRNMETGQCVRVDDCPKPPPKCAINEYLALCGRNCEPTCENRKPELISCTRKECNNHTEACRCMDGHVRNTKTGQCVKVDDCPKPPPKCAANEHLALCGRKCEPTCENKKPDPMSCPIKECNNHTEACRCMDGHVRNAKTGQCVKIDDCPKPPPKCAPNEHLALCGRKCEPTCENKKPDPMSCPIKGCNDDAEACRCMDGHVRNTKTGQCVKVDDCPKPPPKCAANEHLALCGRKCEPTCENKKPDPMSCPIKECNNHTEACRCMDGHVRNAKTGQCVNIDDCPKPPPKCAPNEHLALCGHKCEPTCENKKPDPMTCPIKECNNHTEACQCMDGHVRNTKTGQCVKVDDCPKPPPKCAANEHLALCGRKCEPTCENKKPDPMSCPIKECNNHTEACRCMDGHVRNAKTGQCVKVDDCPKPPPKCAPNEHLALCGRKCEPTCENKKPDPMTCPIKECNNHTEACQCMDGHVRNAKTGQCVKVDDCPKPPPKCAPNEHLALCGRKCEPTCENKKPDPMSCPIKECNNHTEACQCMDGHVRNTKTGQCVKVDDCPKPPPKCAANEHLALCGRKCEPTCENKKPDPMSCSIKECNNHTEACRCMDGHVRNAKTGQCVKVDDCPKPPPKCAPNEHLALCGRKCEPTCENKKPDPMSCPIKECNNHTEACRCMDGHVRNSKTGQCVKVDDCPKPPPKCAANEHFALCGRNCEPTCKNQKLDLMSCPSKECNNHTEACRCMDGHVRNTETGQCVKVDDCPKPPPQCDVNEVFALCGRNCEPTCEHQNAELMPCHSKECNKHTEGCRCMDGHVRNIETGECVRVDDCPKPPPKCAANEAFVLCGRNNEPTCENPKPDSMSCTSKECSKDTQACRCVDGLVRNIETGQCVRVDDCPKPPPKCTIANEHFALCGRNCEPTCEHQQPELMSCHTKECNKHTEGCRCMDGHVRNVETGECVRVDDCPKPPPQCAANEHFALCGRHCEPSCKNPNRNATSCPTITCTRNSQACRCNHGYVRNGQTGHCVKVEQCPIVKPPPKCSANEHFSLCGRYCEPNCKNPHRSLMSCPIISCTQSTQGCRCLKGYVRNRKTGECVRAEDCPMEGPPQKCSPNEHFALCGRHCEPTCKSRHLNSTSCPEIPCGRSTQACRCKDGYVRNAVTGQCCEVEDCPVIIRPHTCAVNEHFALCGRYCEPNCRNPHRNSLSCPKIACTQSTQACRCLDGYVRNRKTGKCVRVEQCPMIRHHRCSDNEHLALCGRNCEPSCRNPNPNSMSCLRMECTEHTQACRCNRGYVRDSITMKCVLQEECAVCRRNEQIGRCGRICEATCNNRDASRCAAVSCAGYGCQCKPGFFRNEETNLCVPVGRCPQECGAGEIFALCGSLCEATCANPSPPEMCKNMKCPTRGCRCNLDAGFVLDEDTGTCIQKEECGCKE